jgi:hypothetical protein
MSFVVAELLVRFYFTPIIPPIAVNSIWAGAGRGQ